MFSIGIDTGGTFTDAFIAHSDGAHWTVKVPTTPHDLTVCFSDAIDESAATVGLSRGDLLRQTEVIRFSSTIATNTALTLTGPRLGLVVTGGEQTSLYGGGDDRFHLFLRPDMIAGIAERISADGEVEMAPEAEEVNRVVRDLLERGARLLVVSLRHATANPANERAVRRIVNQSYPRHYLGAVPTMLSTDVSHAADDASRTAAAVVNAYMHKGLAKSLYKAEDDLRSSGFRHPLLVVSADGSVARVSKTRALSTYQSGPAAGLHAGSLLCRTGGLGAALTADVGGTSTDLGVVSDGRPAARRRVEVRGLEVALPSAELHSIALGGGSVVTVHDGRVQVGPGSAGAAPGPACFGMGGADPTPTDAWLILGYLDPENYLGGRRKLFVDLAARALHERVGAPLGLSTEQAALAVKESAEEAVAEGIREILARPSARAALGNRSLLEVPLVSYGGGGGCLLPPVARRAGLGSVHLPSLGPVFSAFGVDTFDVEHRYERRVVLEDASQGALKELLGAASRDVRGEGFDPAATRFAASILDDEGAVIVEEVAPDGLADALRKASESLDLDPGTRVTLSVHAVCQVTKPTLPPGRVEEGPPSQAERGQRSVAFTEGRREATVYDRRLLEAGQRLSGPCLIESPWSTDVIPDWARCHIDAFGTVVVEWDRPADGGP